VNNTTPYEQLMAAKLDQVPVPDMADSIWAGIELQLNAGAGVPAKKPVPKFKAWVWYGAIVVTIVTTVVLVWLRYTHIRRTQDNTPKQTQPVIQQPRPVTDSVTLPGPVKEKSILPAPVNKRKDSPSIKDSAANVIDSAVRQRLSPTVADTPVIQNGRMVVPPLLVDSINTKPLIPQKQKGVKGIGENDYKIVAEKDSTKKGD